MCVSQEARATSIQCASVAVHSSVVSHSPTPWACQNGNVEWYNGYNLFYFFTRSFTRKKKIESVIKKIPVTHFWRTLRHNRSKTEDCAKEERLIRKKCVSDRSFRYFDCTVNLRWKIWPYRGHGLGHTGVETSWVVLLVVLLVVVRAYYFFNTLWETNFLEYYCYNKNQHIHLVNCCICLTNHMD